LDDYSQGQEMTDQEYQVQQDVNQIIEERRA